MVKRYKGFTNIIGAGTFFEGKLKLKGDLLIDGKYEGDEIKISNITIGPNGKCKTNINAKTVTVEGVLIGDIVTDTRTILLPTARIFGNITTPELIIQNGVIFEGKCKILQDREKSTAKYIEELYENNS